MISASWLVEPTESNLTKQY